MKYILLASAVVVGSVSLSMADPSDETSTLAHPRVTEVNARLQHQDARIDAAAADGKISAAQAAKLHTEDAGIQAAESLDQSLDNGHITRADKRALNQDLNKVSARISGDAHPRIHEVNTRLSTQTARIDRAEADGKISQQQASTLHADDAGIKAEEKTDEAADHGSLTKAAWHALNQLLNKVSGQITDDTHPRVAEVDQRLENQEKRITRDEDDNKITAAQTAAFKADDAGIKADEKLDRSLDDGHLTKADERSLNQNISTVGHQISSAAGTAGSHSASHGGTGSSHGGGSHK